MYMSKVVAVLNQKGGSGKTTIATNLAHALMLKGERVLLVDSDPQGSARDWHEANDASLYPVVGLDRETLPKDLAAIGESQNFRPDLVFQHQAWINISPPGASNKIHYHANCHFSGVYYISLKAPECGSIFFRDPRVASRMFTYPTTQPTEFTTEEVYMPPEEGRMYVFPGWMEHGVEENRSDRDRVSIAFNVLASPRPR